MSVLSTGEKGLVLFLFFSLLFVVVIDDFLLKEKSFLIFLLITKNPTISGGRMIRNTSRWMWEYKKL